MKGKRLSDYIEKQGFTKKKFCEKNEFDYASFTQVLKGTKSMGIIIVDKIHFALPKLNIHWLLYNEGPEEVIPNYENILNEESPEYYPNNDILEKIFLKYLNNENIKNKIYLILKEHENK